MLLSFFLNPKPGALPKNRCALASYNVTLQEKRDTAASQAVPQSVCDERNWVLRWQDIMRSFEISSLPAQAT